MAGIQKKIVKGFLLNELCNSSNLSFLLQVAEAGSAKAVVHETWPKAHAYFYFISYFFSELQTK
jgi:hypothetical protein